MKIHVKYNNLFWYLILIPFLQPRGLSEISPVLNQVFTGWLYVSIIGILFVFIFKVFRSKQRVKPSFVGIILYFGVMLIETLVIQGGINEGLQKMFVTPALFVLFLLTFKNKSKEILNVIANILLINTTLNCTIFSPPILEAIIGRSIYHINFIGHVQTGAQVGLLGIAVGYLIKELGYIRKGKALIIFSIITMLVSQTIVSYICCSLIVLFYFIYKMKSYTSIASISPAFIFIIGTIIQALIIPIVLIFRLDLSGRFYIWSDALNKLSGNYMFGFGVHGVLLRTFWSEWIDPLGFNYAHNEVMQILLDGGILLLLCYLIMCIALLHSTHKKFELNILYWFNCLLLLFMAVGVTDAFTEYNYYYIYMLIINYLPEIISNKFVEQHQISIKPFNQQI